MTRRTVAGAGALIIAATFMTAACGGPAKTTNAGATSPTAATPLTADTPRGRIEELNLRIERLRTSAGMPAMHGPTTTDAAPTVDAAPTTDAGEAVPTTASRPAPAPLNAGAASRSRSCRDVCTISRSICDNAGRICRIAQGDLAGDQWAAAMCTRAQTSCTDAKKRCTTCQQR